MSSSIELQVEAVVARCEHPAAIKAFQAVATDLRRVVIQNAALPSSQPVCADLLLALGGRDAAWLSIRWAEPLLAFGNSGLLPTPATCNKSLSNRWRSGRIEEIEQCNDEVQS